LELGKLIIKGVTQLHKNMFRYFDSSQGTLKLVWYKTVQTMREGESFGERALLKHELRAATVFCSESCVFATLSRGDYNKIIGAAKKKEMKENCEYFRNFRIFSKLRATVLERL